MHLIPPLSLSHSSGKLIPVCPRNRPSSNSHSVLRQHFFPLSLSLTMDGESFTAESLAIRSHPRNWFGITREEGEGEGRRDGHAVDNEGVNS